MEMRELKNILEAVLFVGGEPIKISKLAKISDSSDEEVEKLLLELQAEYESQRRGFFIIRRGDEAQMGSNPEYASFVEKMVKNDLQENLSPAGLEVLSIVAYRGPISRVAIEAIRGVNCSYTLRNLLLRGLVERAGNPNDARGYFYSLSFDFLRKLGIDNVSKLPDYEKISREEKVEDIVVDKEERTNQTTQ